MTHDGKRIKIKKNAMTTALANWNQSLNQWLADGAFISALTKSFNLSLDSDVTIKLLTDLSSPESINRPKIVELTSKVLTNHLGAYSKDTNTIYIDSNLSKTPDLLTQVYALSLIHI